MTTRVTNCRYESDCNINCFICSDINCNAKNIPFIFRPIYNLTIVTLRVR